MRRQNRKGRSKDGRFVRLTHFMLNSPAWLSLTPTERVIYVDLCRLYNGANNGTIGASVRFLADRCNVNKDTAGRALKGLEARGFIACTTPGGFSRKTPHAAEWRLTEYRCDRTHAVPTMDFQRWRPSGDGEAPEEKKRSETEGQPVPMRGTVTRFPTRGGPSNSDGPQRKPAA